VHSSELRNSSTRVSKPPRPGPPSPPDDRLVRSAANLYNIPVVAPRSRDVIACLTRDNTTHLKGTSVAHRASAARGEVGRLGSGVHIVQKRLGRPNMKPFTSFVFLFSLLPAMGGCTDGDAAEPEVTHATALTAATPPTTSRRPRRPSGRTLNPSQTNIRPRATVAKPNVDTPIPFDRPSAPVSTTVSLTSTVASPGTVVPALPLGAGPQLPASRVGARVACASAPTLKLTCPSDAPTPSTCSSADGLPAGCHTMAAPGALYPDNAIPACCS